ncbi:PIN domain-containing protein [Deinococcus aerius]|uniref:PIN domain-containing protein n=1 Tax=Deinococcus aerius TaxID=200253 RepID=A0A2I9CT77_9DEIO|nr:hypothetical protein [Deinococcus aerius]GBF04949.1 PIN domain-containing protein [Deinococcus aerius]
MLRGDDGEPSFWYPPDDVARFLRFLEQTWAVILLTPAHYFRAAERCRDLRLQGGAIYDTLMVEAALQSGATGRVTLNAKHFRRLGEDVARLVIAP